MKTQFARVQAFYKTAPDLTEFSLHASSVILGQNYTLLIIHS